MSNPLVSIIIPCYNQAQYLSEALQSVLDQTYENWECVIVNDGSPDDTEEVARVWLEKDARFRYIDKENGGVSSARNLGLNLSNGRFIQFLDGDDILEKDKIRSQVHFLEIEESVDIVYSSSRYFYTGNKNDLYAVHYTGVVPTIDISKNDTTQKELLILRNVCTICASLYRKEIFEKIEFRNLIYEDWFFHIECAMRNYIFHYRNYLNATSLVRMTTHSQMMRHNQNTEKYNEFKIHLKKLKEEFNFDSKYKSETIVIINKGKSAQTYLKHVFISVTPPIIIRILKNIFYKVFVKHEE